MRLASTIHVWPSTGVCSTALRKCSTSRCKSRRDGFREGRSPVGWKENYVREVEVQRYQTSLLFRAELKEVSVRGSTHAFLEYAVHVVTGMFKEGLCSCAEVLVQLDSHCIRLKPLHTAPATSPRRRRSRRGCPLSPTTGIPRIVRLSTCRPQACPVSTTPRCACRECMVCQSRRLDRC